MTQYDRDLAYCRGQAYAAAGPAPSSTGPSFDATRRYSDPYDPLRERLEANSRDLAAANQYRLYVDSLTRYCMQGLGYR